MVLLLLLTLLGHPSFSVREGAHAQLARLAPLIWPTLAAAEEADDPEIAAHCRVLVDQQWTKLSVTERQSSVAQLRPAGWQKLPWLSSLPEWNRWYLDQAMSAGFSSSGPDWPAYREATRLWLLDMVEAGYTPRELQPLLETMADGDREWCRKHGQPPP
jgi:hypothetical protein